MLRGRLLATESDHTKSIKHDYEYHINPTVAFDAVVVGRISQEKELAAVLRRVPQTQSRDLGIFVIALLSAHLICVGELVVLLLISSYNCPRPECTYRGYRR